MVDLDAGTATGFDGVAGFNTLIGSSHGDTFTGDSNDNLFIGGLGDVITGNGGFDTVLNQQIDVDLNLQVTDKIIPDENDPTNDLTVTVFEYHSGVWTEDNDIWTFASNGKMDLLDVDLLGAVGGSGDNRFDFSAAPIQVYLDGGAGNDTLIGGSEDDILTGGVGIDQLFGGSGYDELIEVRAADLVLSGNTLKANNNDDEIDTLDGIESVYLKAIAENNAGKILDASGANEYDITLIGTEYADQIIASDYGDTLTGSGGADVITGGSGSDVLVEDFAGRTIISDTGSSYELDLAQGTSEIWSISIPADQSGSGFTLTITDDNGTYTTNTIDWDADGWDIVRSIEQAMNLQFGQIAVNDNNDGSWQFEFSARYAGTAIATSVTASEPDVVVTVTEGVQVVDTLIEFDAYDQLSLSGSGLSDVVDLSAFSGLAIISTFAGNDTITGAQGINIIDAGEGNDTVFVTSISSDDIDGGEGSDILVADLAGETSGYTINLDNHQLVLDDTSLSHKGFESSGLVGGSGDDSFDASGFSGVSQTTKLNQIAGWNELNNHILRITLNDNGSTILDIDLSSASTLEELIALINVADDRDTGALNVSFNQENSRLEFTGLSLITVPDYDDSVVNIVDFFGLTGVVSNSAINGLSLSLLASLQLTSQKGNGGADSYIGSGGNDFFEVDSGDISVNGAAGSDSISALTNNSQVRLILTDSTLTWEDLDDTTLTGDNSTDLSNIEIARLAASTGAELLDGSAASIDLVLDAATTTATLKGGTGYNELRLNVDGRNDAATDKVTVVFDDTALGNEVTFYGGSSDFDLAIFDWAAVTGADYTAVRESNDDITINSAIEWSGANIKFKALNGKITVNNDISTDDITDTAGNITLKARNIVISDNVSLSAVGSYLGNHGNITFDAIDGRNLIYGSLEQGAASTLAILPFYYNVDILKATVTIGDATIHGKDIYIRALAESNPEKDMNNDDGIFGLGSAVINDLQSDIEDFKLIAAVSRSDVTSKVTISSDAVLQGDNITIEANSIARVTASPISIALAVAVGVLDTESTVTINGTLLAAGNIDISSRTDNYLDVKAEPLFGKSGFGGAVAVGVLNSDSTVNINDESNIVSGGDLSVKAASVDYSYVHAASSAGSKGKLATSIAVHIEEGDTEALLAGNVLVQGNTDISAIQKQVKSGGFSGGWGTLSEAVVDRVPSIVDRYKDTMKQKVAFSGLFPTDSWLQKKISPSDRLKPTKMTVGIAFLYAEDINRVNAYIGEQGKSSNIQVGGNLNLDASVDNRLLTSTSSVSSTPSQLSQVEGVAGTDTSQGFKQVPFGAAVSVTIASLENKAKAHIQGNTHLDVMGTINVDSVSQNLTGLIAPDTTFKYVKPTLIGKDEIHSDYALKQNDLIRFDNSNYQWSDDYTKPDVDFFGFGAVYKFLGDDQTDILFDQEDFNDGTRWEWLGNEITSFPYQLLGGDTDVYLLDNNINSEAAGAKVSLALNFSLLNTDQTADSRITGTVQINQRTVFANVFDSLNQSQAYLAVDALAPQLWLASDRTLSVDSKVINQSVEWVGNKTSTDTSISFLKKLYALNGASSSGNGVGASVFFKQCERLLARLSLRMGQLSMLINCP